ncbi:hypothetical protein CHS0354_035196 [Potamilus streckersoni]|uniref:ABC transporter ATP-binding protein n=1 Tax=Potamilus streckersoni TaxID=2493646 RepID=A0AAE0S2N3_9BIVA|nr:hypothetical protein CHS0354_035196 [Potamilus streckersoni]
MSEQRKVILKTEKLTKHYGGVHALQEADFMLYEGEHVAIVGDNGAGKSTMVRQLTGVEQPTSGRIFIDGKEQRFDTPHDAKAAGIEAVFQNLALADELDVPSNIFLGREERMIKLGPFSVLNHKKMLHDSKTVLQQTGVKIPDLLNPISNMSGGQRQCVAISRAANFVSKIILMDEPTAALGVQETAQVEEIIRNLKRRGISLILISHNLRQVFDLVDRIWVFRRGRIVGVVDRDKTDGNEVVAMITGVMSDEEDIISEVRKSFQTLSPKLKVVAQYVVDYPQDFAVNSLNTVAAKLDIPQSTIVRLAKHFGFNNGQDFQRTVSKTVISNFDYAGRIRHNTEAGQSAPGELNSPADTLRSLVERNTVAMQHMQATVNAERLKNIVDLMVQAETVFLMGVRRVFPLILQMRYGLSHFHKKVVIIHGLGGMFREEAENIDKNSVLFTVSYYPYSSEPIDIQQIALDKGAKNILLTDSELHPMFDYMDERLIVRDGEFYGLRMLSASMNLVQSIVISVGTQVNQANIKLHQVK